MNEEKQIETLTHAHISEWISLVWIFTLRFSTMYTNKFLKSIHLNRSTRHFYSLFFLLHIVHFNNTNLFVLCILFMPTPFRLEQVIAIWTIASYWSQIKPLKIEAIKVTLSFGKWTKINHFQHHQHSTTTTRFCLYTKEEKWMVFSCLQQRKTYKPKSNILQMK